MRRSHFVLAVVMSTLVASASPTLAQILDDNEVQRAIEIGLSGKEKNLEPMLCDCRATAGFGAGLAAALAGGIQPDGAFRVSTTTNRGAIALRALDAKRLYKPISVADIEPLLREPRVFVTAIPEKPYRGQSNWSVASPIQRIVIRSKEQPGLVLQPESFETESVEWSNLMGGTVTGTIGRATFTIEGVRDLPAGDLEVILVTEAGERRCKIGKKDRLKLAR